MLASESQQHLSVVVHLVMDRLVAPGDLETPVSQLLSCNLDRDRDDSVDDRICLSNLSHHCGKQCRASVRHKRIWITIVNDLERPRPNQ